MIKGLLPQDSHNLVVQLWHRLLHDKLLILLLILQLNVLALLKFLLGLQVFQHFFKFHVLSLRKELEPLLFDIALIPNSFQELDYA